MELSAYEKARLENIKRNNKEMERLKLKRLKTKLSKSQTTSNPNSKSQSRSKSKSKSKSKSIPRRSSTRTKKSPTDSVIEGKEWMKTHSFDGKQKQRKRKRSSTTNTSTNTSTETISRLKKTKRFGLPIKEEDLYDEIEVNAFYIMREWKRARGRELGYVNPCVICHNRTLIEMVRCLPKTREELLAIAGMGLKRYNAHGELMLAALEPLRADLVEAAKTREYLQPVPIVTNGQSEQMTNLILGNGEAHPNWILAQQRDDLPTTTWNQRRFWCANSNNCESCLKHGPNGSWGSKCETLFNHMREMYGNNDLERCRSAGWRWFANPRPKTGDHLHKWWPPASTIYKLGVTSQKIPFSTGQAITMITNMQNALLDE